MQRVGSEVVGGSTDRARRQALYLPADGSSPPCRGDPSALCRRGGTTLGGGKGKGVSAHLSDFLVALWRKQLMLTASMPTFAFFDLEGTSLPNSVEQKRFQALPWLQRPGRTNQTLLSLPTSRGRCSQVRVMMKIAASAAFINDFPAKTWNLLDRNASAVPSSHQRGRPPGVKGGASAPLAPASTSRIPFSSSAAPY